MNFVWVSILVVSLSILVFKQPELSFSTILAGSEKAVHLSIKLWAIYAVWLGILKILEDTKLSDKISRFMQPFVRKFIGKFDKDTENQISINLISNVFGMGNASTPSGINAITGMYKGEKVATKPMLIFLVLNTTSLQLIPTTIIGLRVFNGSVNANDILVPSILASVVSAVSGLLLVNLFAKLQKVVLNKKRQKQPQKSEMQQVLQKQKHNFK